MKYVLIILLVFVAGCCKPSGIETREEIKYITKDSINYITKADTFIVYDTMPFINFFPYVASTKQVVPRTIYRTDGTFKHKFDSLFIQYSLLDSLFTLQLNSTPDTVNIEIITETIKENIAFIDILKYLFVGAILGAVLKTYIKG